MTEPLPLRTSCLIERALAVSAGYRRLNKRFSAGMAQDFALRLGAGAPPALYEHWIGEMENRLFALAGSTPQEAGRA